MGVAARLRGCTAGGARQVGVAARLRGCTAGGSSC